MTLPVEALRDAGLRPGDDVRVVVVGPGRLELAGVEDLIAKFAGAVGDDVYPPGYLDELRR